MTTGRIALLTALALAGCNDGKTNGSAPQQTGTGATRAGAKPSLAQPNAPAGAPPLVTWFKYSPKDGSFAIELPGKVNETDDGGGTKTVGADFGSSDADPRVTSCGIAVTAMLAALDPKTTLDNATTRPKKDWTVVEEKDMQLATHPGRSLIVENGGQRKWMRFFVVDKTLYTLRCTGPLERATLDESIVLKSLGSFEVIAKK